MGAGGWAVQRQLHAGAAQPNPCSSCHGMGVILKAMGLDEPFLAGSYKLSAELSQLDLPGFVANPSDSLQADNWGKLSCKYTAMTWREI